ncbi:methyltransferase domain-containing protein [Methanosarcina siciliae]|nr:SAM-dependent methyltransferase [Methanosarcina siciliae]
MIYSVYIMTITYPDIKPWGRSFEDYVRMFSLTPADLKRKILGCGDGPASFNAELTECGGNIVSIDPVYSFSADQIQERIGETCDYVLDQTRKNQDKFVWQEIGSIAELERRRMSAMAKFLEDFPKGVVQKRYLAGELPSLPFGDGEFDLALCSHLLFLYTDNLSLDFHLRSMAELCRVAKEVRIFPLLDVNGNRSPYIDLLTDFLRAEKRDVMKVKVAYEFQKGGNTMLKIC